MFKKEEYSVEIWKYSFIFISKHLLLWPFRFVAYFIITIVTEPDVKFTNSIEFYVVPIFDKESLKISIVVSLTSYLNTLNRFCYFLLEFHRSIQCLFTVIGFRECVQFHRNWSDIDIFCVLCDKLNLPLAYNANMYVPEKNKIMVNKISKKSLMLMALTPAMMAQKHIIHLIHSHHWGRSIMILGSYHHVRFLSMQNLNE